MNESDNFALVPRQPAQLEKAEPGPKRVLSGMVTDTLALVRSRPLKIILVDDEELLLELIELAIRAKFKNVIVQKFQDSRKALQELQREKPDLLMTDDKMPGLTGEDIVRHLVDRNATYPIIVGGGWPSTEEWVRKIKDKKSNISFLLYPCTTEQLYAEIAKHLAVAQPREMELDSQEPYGALKTPCPKCGGEVRDNYFKFECRKCDFALPKIMAGRQLEIHEVEQLVEKGQVGPLQGFRSTKGFPLVAIIKIKPDFTPEFNFEDEALVSGQRIWREFELKWRLGARTAGLLVKVASQFVSYIEISCGYETASAKSFMGVMMVGGPDAGPGSRIKVTATGHDASAAIDAVTELFTCGSREDHCINPDCMSKPCLVSYSKDDITYSCEEGHTWNVPRTGESER